MPAPSEATYSVDALVDAHTAVLALIDAGTGPGYIAIRDNSDVLLGSVDMDDPAGTVNGTTGQLTITFPATSNSVADGTATYAELCDSDDNVIVSMPAATGVAPVSGSVVINNLEIVSGTPIEVISATIG